MTEAVCQASLTSTPIWQRRRALEARTRSRTGAKLSYGTTSNSAVSVSTRYGTASQLTFSALTRAFTLIYMVSLLSLLTRIQLNLLGRRSYLASIIAQASTASQNQAINLEDRADGSQHSPVGDEFETNRQYLTFSWWLLHKGWRNIMMRVSSAVSEVFGPVKPTADVRAVQFSSLVLELRKRVEGTTAEDRG